MQRQAAHSVLAIVLTAAALAAPACTRVNAGKSVAAGDVNADRCADRLHPFRIPTETTAGVQRAAGASYTP